MTAAIWLRTRTPTPMPTTAKTAITMMSPSIESSTPLDVHPMLTPSAANQGVMMAAVSAAHASP